MKLSIKAGATSQSVNIFIQNNSVTTGAGLAGLVFNTSGLTAYYSFSGTSATSTQIVLATLAAVNSAYSSGGFKELDATNMTGWYRLDIPNAALAAASGRSVAIHLQGAANMAPLPIEIELTGWDNQDAVHGGMSALPNTACTTNASLITSGTGTDQLQVTAGLASANEKQINGVSTSSVTTVNANVGTTQPENFTGTGGSALVKVDVTDIATAAVSATTAQLGVNVVNWNNTVVATPATAGIPDVNVKNMNNVAATPITTIKAVQGLTTADTITTVTGNVNGSVGSVTGAVGSVTGAVGSVTGAVGSVTGNVGGNVTGSVGSVVAAVSVAAGQLFVKKNTQLAAFMFVMTDSTNHNPSTGLTVTATRSIDGAAFGACANAVTEVSSGWYKITLAAADLNGTVIALRFTAAASDDKDITVITQA